MVRASGLHVSDSWQLRALTVILSEAVPASTFGLCRGEPTAESKNPHRESEGLPGGDLSTRRLEGASLKMTDVSKGQSAFICVICGFLLCDPGRLVGIGNGYGNAIGEVVSG